MWIISLGKGFCLGFFAYFLGFLMDLTISQKSMLLILEKTPKLFIEGYKKCQFNLMLLSPIVYSFTDQYLLTHENNIINISKVIYLTLIHHFGYYAVHKSMHKIDTLRKFHDFHHKFDKILCPSIGNAVSTVEFTAAYVCPFICGAILVKPNEITFVIPIALISVFNNLIHCRELKNVPWPAFLVSPKQHLEHHEVRSKHFSAPILNLDYFLEK